MNHAKIICTISLTMCLILLSVSVWRIESKNREERFISRLTIAFRDICDSDGLIERFV